MADIIKLSDKLDDATKYSVRDMLSEAIERVESNPRIKKALVILWDEGAEWDRQILWHAAGTTRQEHLHLLSRAKDEYMMEFALEHTHS